MGNIPENQNQLKCRVVKFGPNGYIYKTTSIPKGTPKKMGWKYFKSKGIREYTASLRIVSRDTHKVSPTLLPKHETNKENNRRPM